MKKDEKFYLFIDEIQMSDEVPNPYLPEGKNITFYDVRGKSYFDYPYKYYCEDIGLRNAQIGFRQQEMTHIMENIIYKELIIRGFSVDVGVVYAREHNENNNSVCICTWNRRKSNAGTSPIFINR